jgi:hypothetical protein
MVTWLDRLVALAGFGMVVGGVVLIHRPAAMIVAGVLLLAAVVGRAART